MLGVDVRELEGDDWIDSGQYRAEILYKDNYDLLVSVTTRDIFNSLRASTKEKPRDIGFLFVYHIDSIF